MTTTSNDPPRWFKPAVFGSMLLAVVILWAVVTRDGGTGAAPVAIGSRSFVFPPAHLVAAPSPGATFIRIKPPEKSYEIVHDSRAAGRRDRAGLPLIFSVNDHGDHDVRYARIGRALVACRRASAPAGGCGSWIDYGGASWSVLFPEAHLNEADRIVRDAAAVLRSYDARSRRLLI